jgi:hypothetical protein
LATLAGTETLTNKRINARVGTITTSTTPAPDANNNDMFTVTALTSTATFAAPSGTPVDGQKLVIRITTAAIQSLFWNAAYRASSDFSLPAATVASKTMYLNFMYNSVSSTWDLVALVNGF